SSGPDLDQVGAADDAGDLQGTGAGRANEHRGVAGGQERNRAARQSRGSAPQAEVARPNVGDGADAHQSALRQGAALRGAVAKAGAAQRERLAAADADG